MYFQFYLTSLEYKFCLGNIENNHYCYTGTVRNLCPELWRLAHLTSLYLNDNNLMRIPADISRLEHLHYLDLSSNKLRNLPAEIGDLIHLRELLLNYNHLRVLPFELGKLFNLLNLGRLSCITLEIFI